MDTEISQEARLAQLLIRLRGETLTGLEQATDIRAANLSVWLRGKPQVISAARVAQLLNHLGIQGMRLRSDIVHHWTTENGTRDIQQLLDLLGLHDQDGLIDAARYSMYSETLNNLVLLEVPGTKSTALIFVREVTGLLPCDTLSDLECGSSYTMDRTLEDLTEKLPGEIRKAIRKSRLVDEHSEAYVTRELSRPLPKHAYSAPDGWPSDIPEGVDLGPIMASIGMSLNAGITAEEILKTLERQRKRATRIG